MQRLLAALPHRTFVRFGWEKTRGNTAVFRGMGRRCTGSGDSVGSFSDCCSDRPDEFSNAGSPVAGVHGGGKGESAALHGLLFSCAVDNTDDVIHGLLADLESPSASIDLKQNAAMELRLLAKHVPENRLRIARAGAIRPLVALISNSDPVLQENGVTAILNLSLLDENKDLIASAGAIKPLVCVLKSGTPTARENAACALFRLSQLEDRKVSIGRSGAIPHLVDLLRTGGPRGKKDASTALYSLCSAKENTILVVEAGIVRPLLDLKADPDSGMADKASYVLFVVVALPECRVAAVVEEGIPVLVEMVEVEMRRQKELYAAVCEILVVLLVRFFDMDHADCVKSFESYPIAEKQIDELAAFYAWCKDSGVARPRRGRRRRWRRRQRRGDGFGMTTTTKRLVEGRFVLVGELLSDSYSGTRRVDGAELGPRKVG